VTHAEPLAQDRRGEVLGAHLRQRFVEMQHHQQVDPQGLDQLGPGAERRQSDRGGVRREEAARMGLEGEHPLGRAQLAGQAPGLADHLLMAAVNAVETSDRDDRALQLVGDVFEVPEDLHGHPSPPASP
jgi:hypothetical protein